MKGAQADHACHLVADLGGETSEMRSSGPNGGLTSNSAQQTPHSSPTNGPGGSVKTAKGTGKHCQLPVECSGASGRTEVATGRNRSSTSLEAVPDVHLLLRLVSDTAQASTANGTLDKVARVGCRRLARRDRAERRRRREEGLRR